MLTIESKERNMSKRKKFLHLAMALTLLLGLGSATLVVAGDHAEGEAALGGYCPVAYVAMGKAVEGKEKFASEYEGHTYYLANAKAKKMFEAEPETYLVAYEGWCATAMAQGMKVASDPQLFIVHEGTTYLFSSSDAKKMLDMDAGDVVAKADANWPKVSRMAG